MPEKPDNGETIISTHTPLARRDVYDFEVIDEVEISTHTPLARRDYEADEQDFTLEISTHTPLARRDFPTSSAVGIPRQFLLTRLLRGVTFDDVLGWHLPYISTHTPLARRDGLYSSKCQVFDISTHTPLARRDNKVATKNKATNDFYSHASCEA